MKNLSRWASRHTRTAIVLLVICEIGNAVNGLLLGMNLLDNWSEGGLLLLISGILAGAFFLQTQSERVAGMRYWVGRRWLFGAFMSNFFLFILLGGLWASRVQVPTADHTAWGARRIDVRSDTLIRPTDARSSNPAYFEERATVNDQPISNQTGKRVGFVLLFLLGITLSSLALGLACNLTCAGNGALAFVVALLGTGIFVGSFFLLSRAFGKVVKPWKQMNRFERRQTYVRALFLMGGFFAVSVLLGRIFN
jgi:MFS family permease